MPQSEKGASAVQKAPIACVGRMAVSLQRDRHHTVGICLATGLERAEKQATVLQLGVAWQIFYVKELFVENHDLLLCLRVEK